MDEMPKKSARGIEDLRASLDRIWLAGLGALAETEKRGDKLFKTLVKKGKKHQLVPFAEAAIDRRIERALERLGVATSAEVASLRKEVAQLREPRGASPTGKRKPAPKK